MLQEHFANLSSLLLIPILLYSVRTLYFLVGILYSIAKSNSKQNTYLNKKIQFSEKKLTLASIIVPARDEEQNIAACIRSIFEADIKDIQLELIIIDDRSSDNTSSIVEEIFQEAPDSINCILHQIKSDSEKQLLGKPGAVQIGIEISKGEAILMTDADCTINPGWIKAHLIQHQTSKTKLSFSGSFTLIKGDTVFGRLQEVEWMFSHTMASAAATLHLPLGCYGNNISASRKLLIETNGFKNIPFSVTEDLALMQAADSKNATITYPCSVSSSVTTQPVTTLKEYIDQRQRWAVGGRALGWKAIAFVISTASITLSLIALTIFGQFALAAALLAFRVLCDTIIILPSAIKLKRHRLLPWVPFSLLALIITESIIPFLLLRKKVVWKGQTFFRNESKK
ncbi:MAG: glycosyltransferase [Candidatus Kapaibacteriales bacterium]